MCITPFGSPVVPGTATLWAWTAEQGQEMGGQQPPDPARIERSAVELPVLTQRRAAEDGDGGLGRNTTLAVVATDAPLTKVQARRLAIQAQDGLAQAVRPAHTAFDGDILFVLSTGRPGSGPVSDLAAARLGALAADTVARAIGRAVWHAETLGRYRSYRETHGR